MNIVGIDIGFKQFKGVSLGANVDFKFQNIIGFPSELEISPNEIGLNVTLSDLTLEYNNVLYYIGEKAKNHATNHRYTFLANKIDTIDEKIKMLTGLGILSSHGITNVDVLVTGTPVEEYHMVKDRIKSTFTGEFSYMFRGEQMYTNICQVYIIPQGAGDYYDHVLTDEGEVIQEYIKPKTLIVNIGYRTTEIVVMNYGKFSRAESTTLYTATNTFHKELLRLIVKEYGTKKNLTEIEEIYRSGQLHHHGRVHDITHLIKRAVDAHIGSIIGEIPIWVNPAELHNIILTGGGSNRLQPYFQQEFGCEVIQHHYTESGNARGYNKYGRLIVNEQRNSVQTC